MSTKMFHIGDYLNARFPHAGTNDACSHAHQKGYISKYLNTPLKAGTLYTIKVS